jgi:hypothetical protein
MPLVPAICTQCGAQIEVDNTHEAGICKHCGTAFVTEKAINNYNTHVINNNNFAGANVVILNEPKKKQPFVLGVKPKDDSNFYKNLQASQAPKEETIGEKRARIAERIVTSIKQECQIISTKTKNRELKAKIVVRPDSYDYDWGCMKAGNIDLNYRSSFDSEESWIIYGSIADFNTDNQNLLPYIRSELRKNGFPENCIYILDEDDITIYDHALISKKPKYKKTGRKTNVLYIDLSW